MSADGFENTFVCVHTHLGLVWYVAADISAVQREGVHLKGSLVLIWGLGQGKGGLSSVRNHFMLLLADSFCKLQGWGLPVLLVLHGKKQY